MVKVNFFKYQLILITLILVFSCRDRRIPADGGRYGDEVPGHVTASLSELMGQSLEQMQHMQLSGDPDYDYASLMTIHHQTGIAMSDYQIRRSQDSAMVELAREIQEMQERELFFFTEYTREEIPMVQEDVFIKKVDSLFKEFEGKKDKISTEEDVEEDFPELMILHHQKGISLAELHIEYGREVELLNVAKESVHLQQQQIEALEEFKKKE